jgi:hypothetical protein
VGTISEICRCERPEIAIGTGYSEFEALEDGDGVVMVYGPQGGWHIWGSIRASNTRNVIKIRFTAEDLETGVQVVDVTNQVALAMESECTGVYTGIYGFLDILPLSEGDLDTPPELLCMNELALRMTVSDSGGRVIQESLQLLALPDDVDAENCIE